MISREYVISSRVRSGHAWSAAQVSAFTWTAAMGCFLGILLIWSPQQIRNPQELLENILLALSILALSAVLLYTINSGSLASLIGLAAVLIAFSQFFEVVGRLQLALVPFWLDDYLISLDAWIWGKEFSLLLVPIRNPILTEGLMFSYVAYIPALFITGLLCLRSGPQAVEQYTVLLVRTYWVCYVGFLIFPVASQGFYGGAIYNGAFDGGLFTSLADSLRTTVHFPGGSFPSAHCGATTIMLVALWRFQRKSFWVCLPILVPIYAATVYGQFHYVWDSLSGILAAVFVIRFSASDRSIFRIGG